MVALGFVELAQTLVQLTLHPGIRFLARGVEQGLAEGAAVSTRDVQALRGQCDELAVAPGLRFGSDARRALDVACPFVLERCAEQEALPRRVADLVGDCLAPFPS